MRLAQPPRHSIEQAGVKTLTTPGVPDSLFSIVTAGGRVGRRLDLHGVTSRTPRRSRRSCSSAGRASCPRCADAEIEHVRACARPLSVDGRPLLGPVPGLDGLHLITGHGPWGISLGPGSAQAVGEAVLGEGAAIAPELAAARFGAP